MDDAVIGKEVDGYHVESILGRGGMGVVYKAEDVALSRPVALKRINPAQAHREQFLRRFRSEAKALARINSPYITSIYALRDTDIGLLIVMEYVDGGTLKDRIENGPMRPAEVIPIVRQILQAFHDAHGAGVIHRDIKPQNIMMTSDGGVKITDFGIAKLRRQDSGETVTQGGQGGTLKYMSPEQIEKIDEVDNRSDLYALGMTMYEMLAGRLPFKELDTDFDIMRKVVEGDVPPPSEFVPNLPDQLSDLIQRATATRPEDRFPSADAMREALDAAADVIDDTDPQPMWAVDGDDTASSGTATDAGDTVIVGNTGSDAGRDTGSDAEGATASDSDTGTILDDELLDEIDASDAAAASPSAPPSAPSSASQPSAVAADRGAKSGPPSGSSSPEEKQAESGSASGSSSVSTGLVGGVIAAVLLLAAGAYFVMAPGGPAGTPTLTLETAPAAAVVEIDGDSVGVSPIASREVEPGTHTLTIRKAGFEPVERTVTISPGQALVLGAVELEPRPAQVRVTSEPAGARVFVGNTEIGTTPVDAASVAAGEEQVRLEKDGYATLDTLITFKAGSQVTLAGLRLDEQAGAVSSDTPATGSAGQDASTASASSSSPDRNETETAMGQLQVTAPGEVTVRIDGTEHTGGGTYAVPAGTNTVQCLHPDYQTIETDVSVSQTDTESVSCVYRHAVFVSTIENWGNIYVNGANSDVSTPGTIELTPGRYRIEVRRRSAEGFRIQGGNYRLVAVDEDEEITRTSFDTGYFEVEIEPAFRKYKHSVIFRPNS